MQWEGFSSPLMEHSVAQGRIEIGQVSLGLAHLEIQGKSRIHLQGKTSAGHGRFCDDLRFVGLFATHPAVDAGGGMVRLQGKLRNRADSPVAQKKNF